MSGDYFDQHYVDYHAALHDEYSKYFVHHHHGAGDNDILVHDDERCANNDASSVAVLNFIDNADYITNLYGPANHTHDEPATGGIINDPDKHLVGEHTNPAHDPSRIDHDINGKPIPYHDKPTINSDLNVTIGTVNPTTTDYDDLTAGNPYNHSP